MEEAVLAVPRRELEAALPGGALPSGLLADPGQAQRLWSAVERGVIALPRSRAEEDPAHKQIITYVVMRRGTELFAYRRLGGGGETRLRGFWSIGVGGHMNPDPANGGARFMDLLRANLRRELAEELRVRPFPRADAPRFLGFINHDETPVGRVHLGLLVLLDLAPDTRVRVRETDKLEGGWFPASDVRAMSDRLEGWSRAALAAIEDTAGAAIRALAPPHGPT